MLLDEFNAGDVARISQAALREVQRKPLTIIVIGVSGVGKSSVINRIFKSTLPVSHTVACTREFMSTDLSLQMTNGVAAGIELSLRVIDCPGLGEDISKDPEYLDHYLKHLQEADITLFVSAARNRAVALEQKYLYVLKEAGYNMVFGLSQVDLVEPLNWNERLNLPSKEQANRIAEICEDRANRFGAILGKKVSLVPFSSRHGFGLQQLFTAMIFACPEQRAWLFDGLKAFKFSDFVPKAAIQQLGNDL